MFHERHFTLRQGLSQILIKLTQMSDDMYKCYKCNGDVKQDQLNPFFWSCVSCKAEYMGPVREK